MIDKALAERLADPLFHLLRNAVDHGVEAPKERSRAGKPSRGRVTVSATDKEYLTEIVVREAARAAGVPRNGDATPLVDLLCHPGFSTRGDVTSTSGRGVGLDLVRTTLDEFGGEIEIESELGRGSAFTLRVPKLRAVNIVDADHSRRPAALRHAH